MSEKVTFSELVEIIARESEHSKKFTHDFLKDFVSVIRQGLESDGTVNIAGMGKFDLQRVEEREGYNPQTEEKMIIPAHNKIVFKPYKGVRELINAPYAHIEPKLIEEAEDQQEKTKQQGNTGTENTDPLDDPQQEQGSSPTEEQEPQDDFIPTGPPTQHHKEKDLAHSESKENKEQKQQEPEQAPALSESEIKSEETPKPESSVVEFDPEDTSPASPLDRPTPRQKNSTSIPIVVAASFLLILIAGAAWYFSILTDNSQQTSEVALTTPQTTNTTNNARVDRQPSQSNNSASKNKPVKATKQEPNQSKAEDQKQTAPNSGGQSNGDKKKNIDNMTIARGQTLWSIAEDTYGNPRLWPWIYGTNEPLEDPDVIIAGHPLDVPLPSGPGNSLNAADSLGVSKGFLATYRWYKNHQSDKAKNHLWAAKLYYENVRNITDVQIDQADLKYANQAR